MTHSLNEVEAISKRAARGAGLSWGLAEEAARGTRWLCAFGLPGAALLADLLEMNDRLPAVDVAPVSLREPRWQAAAGRLSPLVAGASLSDCAVRLEQRGAITMENLCLPLLAAPFAGSAALRLGRPVTLAWQDLRLTTDGRSLCIQGDRAVLTTALVPEAEFSVGAQVTNPGQPVLRAEVSEGCMARLAAFGQRTFAPATEESRLLGAGAGLNDND